MKYFILFLFAWQGCNSHKEPVVRKVTLEPVISKPDSVWTETKCDSLFGKIEIDMDGVNKVIGKGMAVICKETTWHKGSGNMSTGIVDITKTAYLKTNNGYKQFPGTFVITPN